MKVPYSYTRSVVVEEITDVHDLEHILLLHITRRFVMYTFYEELNHLYSGVIGVAAEFKYNLIVIHPCVRKHALYRPQ